MMEHPRVVIDTNLVLSALVFGGRLSRLRLAWQNNRFIPLASEVTISELVRVLTYPKFKLTNSEQEDLLSDYLPFCDTVLMPDTLPVVPECRDPFDLPFLLLAVVGRLSSPRVFSRGSRTRSNSARLQHSLPHQRLGSCAS
jgi:uncharacterized protein